MTLLSVRDSPGLGLRRLSQPSAITPLDCEEGVWPQPVSKENPASLKPSGKDSNLRAPAGEREGRGRMITDVWQQTKPTRPFGLAPRPKNVMVSATRRLYSTPPNSGNKKLFTIFPQSFLTPTCCNHSHLQKVELEFSN